MVSKCYRAIMASFMLTQENLARGCKTFSCSALLSMKFILLINLKILYWHLFFKLLPCSTQLSMLGWVEHEKSFNSWYFLFLWPRKISCSVEHEKSFITSRPGICCPEKKDRKASRLAKTIQGKWIHSQGRQLCQNCFYHPPEKGVYSIREEICSPYSKRKDFAPLDCKRKEFAP